MQDRPRGPHRTAPSFARYATLVAGELRAAAEGELDEVQDPPPPAAGEDPPVPGLVPEPADEADAPALELAVRRAAFAAAAPRRRSRTDPRGVPRVGPYGGPPSPRTAGRVDRRC